MPLRCSVFFSDETVCPTLCPCLNPQLRCGVGTYSPGGPNATSPCLPCPAGRFGNTTALANSTCSGVCPAGYSCPLGTGSPILCPAGTYAPQGAAFCTLCPTNAPYSPAGSAASTVCSACTGVCGSATVLYGAYMCPRTAQGWAGWLDAGGVEGNNSCVLYNGTQVTADVAKAYCASLGSGVHMLTSAQVTMCAQGVRRTFLPPKCFPLLPFFSLSLTLLSRDLMSSVRIVRVTPHVLPLTPLPSRYLLYIVTSCPLA